MNLKIKNWDSIESDKNYNHYDFYYESVIDEEFIALPSFVKVETALMSYSFPTEKKLISNYIYDTLKDEEPELIREYNLVPFEMSVQCINRTFIDKIFALGDYYIQNKARRNSRHLYDIYKLAPYIVIDESFLKLVKDVREHRKNIGDKIAPSANDNVNVLQLAQEIYDTKFYEEDYYNTTLHIISDEIDYDKVIKCFIILIKKIFKNI